jgi:hypothetical protein
MVHANVREGPIQVHPSGYGLTAFSVTRSGSCASDARRQSEDVTGGLHSAASMSSLVRLPPGR